VVNRADWVLDVMPYETRNVMIPEGFGPRPERYSADTWVRRDMCAHEPWPWEDDFFDTVICTFTLEDVRDPVWVCREMSRVGKAGYIEVPTWLDELTWGNPEGSGGAWVGHEHHRWLVSLEDGVLVFLAKFHSLHANWRVQVPPRWAGHLSRDERILDYFWEGELPARERAIVNDFPYDELERVIHKRFHPSESELRIRELRERAKVVAMRGGAPIRRAVSALLDRAGGRVN
jgi:hypothetical protein